MHQDPLLVSAIDALWQEHIIDSLVQDCSISRALSMEILQSPLSHLDNVSDCMQYYVMKDLGWDLLKPFINFSMKEIFDLSKIPVRFFVSLSYFTGVTTAELQQHL